MKNFYKPGKELPKIDKISIMNMELKFRGPRLNKKQINKDYNVANLEGYISYLASLRYAYHLKINNNCFYTPLTSASNLNKNLRSNMRNKCEKVNKKLDRFSPIVLKPNLSILNLIIFCFLLVGGIQTINGQDINNIAEIRSMNQKDTINSKNQNGSASYLSIANLLQQKKDYKVDHDYNKPLVALGNGIESESVIFQSVLSRYQKGFKSGNILPSQAFSKYGVNNGNVYLLGCYNTTLMNIFTAAYLNGKRNFTKNRVILEVNDPSKLTTNAKGQESLKWLEKNGYCYELVMPVAVGKEAVYKQMQNDLKRMFPQYKANIETRNIECYALIRTSNEDKIKTKGGKPSGDWNHFGFSMQNFYGLSYFLVQLEYFLQKEIPLIDKTNYEEKIDIDIKAKLTSIEEINKALMAYDLQFVREIHPMDVLVISDSGEDTLNFNLNAEDFKGMPRNFDWEPLKKGGK